MGPLRQGKREACVVGAMHVPRCLLVLLALISVSRADLPNHCLREHVAGNASDVWTFHLGPADGDENIQCKSGGHHWRFDGANVTESSTMRVKLSPTDFTATEVDTSGSATGSQGTWTMIYDEGWELRIGGKKFFAWCKFGMGNSYCYEVSTGMYHNDDGTNWGCYWAERDGFEWVNSGGGGGIVQSSLELLQDDEVYQPEVKLVEAVNSKNLGWKAKLYPRYNGMTLDHMRKAWGGIGKPMPKTQPDIDEWLDALQITGGDLDNGSGGGANGGADGVGPETFPDTWDWRDMNGTNYINPAYEQGWCGSCWAVAAADALSARVAIASGNKIRPMISSQEMLTCATPSYGQGCEGGWPYLGYKYAQDYGIGTGGPPGAQAGEDCTDYKGSGYCQIKEFMDYKPDVCNDDSRIRVKDYYYIGGGYGGGNAASMMREVMTNGPITVCIEPSSQFQHYDTGVFDEDESISELQLNLNPFQGVSHAVVVVGWGTGKAGKKYWIMKNSNGKDWGDGGFAYVPLGQNAMYIENMPTAATVILPQDWETKFKGKSHH